MSRGTIIPNFLCQYIHDENLTPDESLNRGTAVWYGIHVFPRDVSRAERLWLRALNANPPASNYVYAAANLGLLYQAPPELSLPVDGVPQNIPRAVEMYRLAIDGGYPHADVYANLGDILMNGSGSIKRDKCEAVLMYHHAANIGNPKVLFQLTAPFRDGEGEYPSSLGRVVELFYHSSPLGCNESRANAASVLLGRRDSVEIDVAEGFKLLENVAEVHHLLAIYTLSDIYLKGCGHINADLPRAKQLYRTAALRGYLCSPINPGLLTTGSTDEEHDDVSAAHSFLGKAIEDGILHTREKMGQLSRMGLGQYMKVDALVVLQALPFFHRSITLQNRSSLVNLAVILSESVASANVQEAFRLYEQSLLTGNADVMEIIGTIYNYGAGPLHVDHSQCQKHFSPLSENMEIAPMSALRNIHRTGGFMDDSNILPAIPFFEKAITAGDADAIFNLVGIYFTHEPKGLGVDIETTIECYSGALHGGHNYAWKIPRCIENLPIDREHIFQAIRLYKAATERNLARAIFNQAKLYQHGNEETEIDMEMSVTLYRKAADLDFAEAFVNLANMLLFGNGVVSQDINSAVNLSIKAVEAGSSHAMYNLGNVYRYGCGDVRVDVARSIDLHQKAVDLSHPLAMANLGLLHQFGSDEHRRDQDAAKEIFEKEWAIKHEICGFQLAMLLMYASQEGHRDEPRALGILEELILKHSYSPAAHELAVLYERHGSIVSEAHLLSVGFFKISKHNARYSFDFGDRPMEIYEAGSSYPDIVRKTLSVGTSMPKKCLLLTLGGGGRGKTCTVNSIRHMRFVESHDPTEMAEFCCFVSHPSSENYDAGLISEIDFNDSSLDANVSRLFKPSDSPFHNDAKLKPSFKPTLGISNYSSPAPSSTFPSTQHDLKIVKSNANHPHADVIERVRRPLVQQNYPRVEKRAIVQVWDMGGQSEYEMAHSPFISHASIILFVIDLERFCDVTTRVSEVETLCNWLQLAHTLIPDPSSVAPLIVGTRKAGCDIDEEHAINLLEDEFSEHLCDSVYRSWVQRCDGKMHDLSIQAIENKNSPEDRIGSGAAELEHKIEAAAINIAEQRKKIPIRWMAFVDKLIRDGRKFFTREEILGISEEFPGFVEDVQSRESDVLDGLKCFSSMGQIVFMELSKNDYYVFKDVEDIISVVGKTATQDRTLKKYLDPEERRALKKGLTSRSALFKLWGDRPRAEKEVLLKLLIEFDLLIELRSEEDGSALIGVPALLDPDIGEFKWGSNENDRDLSVTTTFSAAIPPGVIGRLMGFLHRTIGSKTPNAKLIRRNAALVTVNDSGRLFVTFKNAQRSLCWIFRGTNPVNLAKRCLKKVEELLNSRTRYVGVDRKYEIVNNCEESAGGCGCVGSVVVPLSQTWIKGDCEMRIDDVICTECHMPWSTETLRNSMGLQRQVSSVKYDVFVSHAGPDKLKLAQPLHQALERAGFTSFFDLEELKCSTLTAPENMHRAMSEAKVGIFILSPDFAARRWTMIELRRFLQRNREEDDPSKPAILPVFYRLGIADVPLVYDVDGPHQLTLQQSTFFEAWRQTECCTEDARNAMKELRTFSGVEIPRVWGR